MISFDEFRNLIDKGETVRLTVNGTSMSPFLKSGIDSVFAVKGSGIYEIGDVAFFTRKNGVVVMHRIVKKDGDRYWFCGDAQKFLEGPIEAERIFAKVVGVVHNNKPYNEKSVYFKFFSDIWCKWLLIRPRLVNKI